MAEPDSQPKSTEEVLLQWARACNEIVGHAVALRLDPLYYLVSGARECAKDIYKEAPHWHHFTGKCMKGTPFEIEIGALAHIASVWVADIFLRKARDRGTPRMEATYLDWKQMLFSALEYTEREVKGTRDRDAEAAWQRDRRPRGRLRCLINRVRWRH